MALGETVEVRRHGVIEARGRINDISVDGSFLWLMQDGALGRRIFRAKDNIRIFRAQRPDEPDHTSETLTNRHC